MIDDIITPRERLRRLVQFKRSPKRTGRKEVDKGNFEPHTVVYLWRIPININGLCGGQIMTDYSAGKSKAKHVSKGDMHFISLSALHVLLMQDGDGWFAQGREIDYAAGGATIDEVKKNFGEGLARTIEAHLAKYENITKLLKFVPGETWNEFLKNPPAKVLAEFSLLQECRPLKDVAQRVDFPFSGIEFLRPELERVAV